MDLTELEITPVGFDGVEGDDVAGRGVEGGPRAPVQGVGEVRVVDLPTRVDLVDHGVQGVPDGVLGRDVDRVHLAPDAEVSPRVDAQAGAPDDPVEEVLEVAGVGGVGGGQELGRVGVRLGDVGVEVPHQAHGGVGEGVVGERPRRERRRVDELDRGDHVCERAGRHAPSPRAVGDGEFGSQHDRPGVVVEAVAGHAVLGAVEDRVAVRVVGRLGEVPVRESPLVAARLLEVGLVEPQEVPVPGQEEGVEVHVLGAVDVDHGVVHVSVGRGRVECLVELGRLSHQALDGVSVRFPVGRSHVVEVDASPDVFRRARPVVPLSRGGPSIVLCVDGNGGDDRRSEQG